MLKFNEYHAIKEEIEALQEILLFESEFCRICEAKKPSAGLSKKKKSNLVKKARRGEDMFGHGKEFDKIAKSAAKRYGSEEAGKRVAGAIFWKKARGKHMTNEDVEDLIWILEDDIKVILDTFNG